MPELTSLQTDPYLVTLFVGVEQISYFELIYYFEIPLMTVLMSQLLTPVSTK
jgi:hypothetical protein